VLPLAVGRQKTIALIKDAVRDDQVIGSRPAQPRRKTAGADDPIKMEDVARDSFLLADGRGHRSLVVADRILDQRDGLLRPTARAARPQERNTLLRKRQDGEDWRNVLLVDQARLPGDDFAFLGTFACSPRPLRNFVPRVNASSHVATAETTIGPELAGWHAELPQP